MNTWPLDNLAHEEASGVVQVCAETPQVSEHLNTMLWHPYICM
jgi:hypothetical protein